jgi:hypothetical protein
VRLLLASLALLAACSSSSDAPVPDEDYRENSFSQCVDACETMISRVADSENRKHASLDEMIDPAAAPEACMDFCKAHPGFETACMYTATSIDDAARCAAKHMKK